MTLAQIKQATDKGHVVYWSNELYEVVKYKDEYMIRYNQGDNYIGLTHKDGVTLNGLEDEFFIGLNF